MTTTTSGARPQLRKLEGKLSETLGGTLSIYGPLLSLPLTTDLTIKPKAEVNENVVTTPPSVTQKKATYIRPSGEVYIPRKVKVGKTAEFLDVDIILTSRSAGLPVLLYGPPGTGKTALIEAVFPDLVTVQGSGETEVADFVGGWTQQTDGSYLWVDGPLVIAAEAGVPLLVDEIALIDPRVMAVVYGLMDGRSELTVTANPDRGIVKAAPGFYVFGAFNPDVPGAVLSDALLSRFAIHIEVTTDWSLAKKLGVPADIITVVRNLHHKLGNGEIVSAPQIRELLVYKRIAEQFGVDLALANLVSQSKPEDQAIVTEAIESVFSKKIDTLKIGG